MKKRTVGDIIFMLFCIALAATFVTYVSYSIVEESNWKHRCTASGNLVVQVDHGDGYVCVDSEKRIVNP